MKKLFYTIFILCASALFFSCGDDDDKKEKDPNDMTIEEYMSEDRPFVWNGDWNDPEDPNYKPGGYNPLAETYWLVSESDKENASFIFYFTKKFDFIWYKHDKDRNVLIYMKEDSPYRINNRAYHTPTYGYTTYGISKDGKTLYENQNSASTVSKLDWKKYSKFDASGINKVAK